MEELVGPEIVARYTIVDHELGPSRIDAAHVAVGRGDGTPILLARE